MGRTAGQISINLSAGVASLVVDLEKAKARFADYSASAAASANKVAGGMREIGTHGVSEIQAASGAIRVLEGGLNSNVRAAERFLTSIAGLGPALQKIFPLVGGVAIAGLLVKIGEEAYKAGQNFLYLRDAEKEAMNVGIQLAGEADAAFGKISSLQVQALDEQGRHMEAAQEKQRNLMSTPVKLPDLLNQEKIKSALDTMQNQPGWIKLKNLFSEVIPADIPARIEQMKSAMKEAQDEIDKINQHRVGGVTDPLSAHFFAQDTVEVNLYAQALELLAVKQKEVAQEVGAAGAQGFKKSQEQAGSLAVKNVENEIQANARLTELKKQTADTIIKQNQMSAEASIQAMEDPYARAIALANLEVEIAKQKQTLLTKIASDGADEQIALLYKKAEAEKIGKNPAQQEAIDATTRGGVGSIQDQSAANTLELHYAVEVAQQKARVTGTEEQRKAYADLNKEIEKGFTSLEIGWKDAQERVSRYTEELALAEIKANETREKSQGEVFDLRIVGQKLTLEKQYGEQIAHTYSQQIAYMQQVANLDHNARQEKIKGLQGSLNAIPNDPNNPAEIDKRATIEGQIAVLKEESRNADIEAATKISEELQKQNASLQAQKELAQTLVNWSQIGIGNFEQSLVSAATQIPQELSNSLFDSIFNRPKRGQSKGQEVLGGLAKTGEGAAKTVGTELLTLGIQKLLGSLLPSLLKNTAMIANTTALTTLTAAVTANTAAQTASGVAGAAGGAASAAGGVASAAGSTASTAATGLTGPLIAAAGGVIGGVISALATYFGDKTLARHIDMTTAAVQALHGTVITGTGSANSANGLQSSQSSPSSSSGSLLSSIFSFMSGNGGGGGLLTKIPGLSGILGGFGQGGGTPVRIVGIDPGVFAGMSLASSGLGWLAGLLGFAGGGDPSGGSPFIAGERGKEIINPRGKSFTVIPLSGAGALPVHGYPEMDSRTTSGRSGPSMATVSTQSHSVNVGGVNIYEASNPGETARQLSDYLKGVSPQFSPAR